MIDITSEPGTAKISNTIALEIETALIGTRTGSAAFRNELEAVLSEARQQIAREYRVLGEGL